MFKVGDRVQTNTRNRNYVPIGSSIVTIKRLEYELDGTELIIFDYKGTEWGGYFSHRFELVEPATPIDKQAAVIAKIKYLNTRFDTRKQHAALG